MDILYFLEERTTFIRYYYGTAEAAFLEIQRKIDACDEPFGGPKYDESGEPVHLEEWSAASDGITVLGRSCLAMVKSAMHAYFEAWKSELGIKFEKDDETRFKKGILNGYRHVYQTILGEAWDKSGVDLDLLEQVVLARNADQHEGSITTIHASHPEKDRKRFGARLQFVSQIERKWRAHPDTSGDPFPFFLGHVEAPKDVLFTAIAELEKLAAWLEPQLIAFQQAAWRSDATSRGTTVDDVPGSGANSDQIE
jgi:hypothetical protein